MIVTTFDNDGMTHEELHEMLTTVGKKLKEIYPDETLLFIPKNIEICENYPVEELIRFRDYLNKIIEEKQ